MRLTNASWKTRIQNIRCRMQNGSRTMSHYLPTCSTNDADGGRDADNK